MMHSNRQPLLQIHNLEISEIFHHSYFLLFQCSAVSHGQLARRQEAQYPPLSESLSRAASALRDAGGRTFENGVQFTSQALGRAGQAVDVTGKYIAAGVGAGVGTAIYLGSRGAEIVGDGYSAGKEYVQHGTAQGLRATVIAIDTVADLRRRTLDNVAHYTRVGADKTNQVLDQFNDYKKETLLNLADSIDSKPNQNVNQNVDQKVEQIVDVSP